LDAAEPFEQTDQHQCSGKIAIVFEEDRRLRQRKPGTFDAGGKAAFRFIGKP